MTAYESICYIFCVSLAIAWIQRRIIKIQQTIVITFGALLLSILIIVIGKVSESHVHNAASALLSQLHIKYLVLDGMLGFLLFAGALKINVDSLKRLKWQIASMAFIGTLVSTALVGLIVWKVAASLSIDLPLIYCFLFGALISPTDPIAIIAILSNLKVSEDIHVRLEGESLFNDAISLVLFIGMLDLLSNGEIYNPTQLGGFFLLETLGGILFGLILGRAFHALMGKTKDHDLELLSTITIPTAGYVTANKLGLSGPLAMVIAGIIIGNTTYKKGFSDHTRATLKELWNLVEEMLNAVLFMLIGLVLVIIDFSKIPENSWWLIAVIIPTVILVRFLSTICATLLFKPIKQFPMRSAIISTWGGLRGGLAIAMALSIPLGIVDGHHNHERYRELLIMLTYCVVLFSIVVQGATIAPLIRKLKQLKDEEKVT